MPAWFVAPLIGAAGGIALDYTIDHFFGDSEFTAREAFVAGTTGALGGGLVRPGLTVGSRFGKVVRNYGDDTYKVGASAVDDLIVAGYISAPMVSRPARMEFIGGAVAGLVYDIAYGKSPDVRSERNASDVASGGTSSGKKSKIPRNAFRSVRGKYPNFSCPKGYTLMNWEGKMVCVLNKFVPN